MPFFTLSNVTISLYNVWGNLHFIFSQAGDENWICIDVWEMKEGLKVYFWGELIFHKIEND